MTPANPSDSLASLRRSVAEAGDDDERDRRRFALVTGAARRRLWERARAAAAEITDEVTRGHARRVIAIQQVMSTLRAFENEAPAGRGDEGVETERVDHVGRAADFVRAADVPPEVRAAGLAQAAELAARHGDKTRAADLVGEAAVFAQQAEREAGRRTLAFAHVTRAALRLAEPRAWETLAALVRSADADEGLELASAALTFDYDFEHLGRTVSFTPEGDALDRREVFADAARLDLARTLAEARALKHDVLRAGMLFAVARAALAREDRRGPKRDARTAP